MSGIDAYVAGIGALAEPVRRELYRYVCSQPEPVSRDQAAQAVQIARHQAKFHLDRLEAAGLLEADYVRLTGRTGPGAGRPAKRYRRGGTEFAISVPPRDYELAGHIMAEAIAESARTGAPIQDTLDAAAEAQGAAIAATSAQRPQSTENARRPDRRPAQPERLRTSPNGLDHRAGELPVPGPGTQPHRTGLSDEPLAHQGALPVRRGRPARCPAPAPGQPLLRPTYSPARVDHPTQRSSSRPN